MTQQTYNFRIDAFNKKASVVAIIEYWEEFYGKQALKVFRNTILCMRKIIIGSNEVFCGFGLFNCYVQCTLSHIWLRLSYKITFLGKIYVQYSVHSLYS